MLLIIRRNVRGPIPPEGIFAVCTENIVFRPRTVPGNQDESKVTR